MGIDDPGMPSGGPVRTTDLGEITLEQLQRALRDCLTRLDGAGIAYGVMGGLAVTTLARPRWTHDIDVFLRPRDAARALEVLADAGYEIERFDHEWLFKAWSDGVMIDLIFRSSGNIYFDDDLEARLVDREFLGVPMKVVSPEDLLVVKAAADTELNHYHWFDALGILAAHDLDWDYVLRRARTSQRHLLSFLVYADALDTEVPPGVIAQLAARLYGGDGRADRPPRDADGQPDTSPAGDRTGLEEELRQRLRQHPSLRDLDIHVRIDGDTAVVTGDVETPERCGEISRTARQLLPGWEVVNEVTVRRADGQPHVEVVS